MAAWVRWLVFKALRPLISTKVLQLIHALIKIQVNSANKSKFAVLQLHLFNSWASPTSMWNKPIEALQQLP